MEKTSSRILMGCGIGCGVLVVVFIVAIIAGYFFIKDTIRSSEEIELSRQMLEDRYGKVVDYTPSIDGKIQNERLNLFVQIRDSLKVVSKEFENSVENFTYDITETERDESVFNVFGTISSGVGLIPAMTDFYYKRNTVLFDLGMSLGEYSYYYSLIYYCYFKEYPGDGPIFPLEQNSSQDFNIMEMEKQEQKYGSLEKMGEEVLLERNERMRKKVNRIFRNFYQNVIDKMNKENIDNQWKEKITEQIAKLKGDLKRLPWEDELPDEILRSIEPFEIQLEGSYNKMANILELSSHN